MSWTIADDDNVIHIRAVLNLETDKDEIRQLIAALEKRLTRESPDERHADV